MTNKKELLPSGIYGITAEKFSCGRSNIHVVEEMIKGGIKVIQYREKRHLKDYCDILAECQAIRTITQEHGVTFIINDFVDIALLVNADGVHVGQEDLPVDAVRRLLGPNKIIGLSTHSASQAEKAQEAGADYIGVGPIYATNTKKDIRAKAGFDYLEYVVKNVTIPFVAIGGIKQHNINEVVKRGAQSICLVSEIVGADDIAQTVTRLNNVF